MRINNNISALNTFRQYSTNTVTASKSMEKLSSGLRINRAADDAAGLSISEKMRAQIRGLTQAERNAQDGISLIQTAEGALNEVSDMLTRMKELGVQAANGTYSGTDTANIKEELTALQTAINDIIGVDLDGDEKFEGGTHFNGMSVFNQDILIAYQENGTSLTIDAATLSSVTINPTSIDLSDPSAFVTSIDGAIDAVNTQRAKYGALQNRLEHVVNNINTTTENLQAAESRIRDVDMAREMMEFTKDNILVQAAQSMLAQANMQPQGVLQLLR